MGVARGVAGEGAGEEFCGGEGGAGGAPEGVAGFQEGEAQVGGDVAVDAGDEDGFVV